MDSPPPLADRSCPPFRKIGKRAEPVRRRRIWIHSRRFDEKNRRFVSVIFLCILTSYWFSPITVVCFGPPKFLWNLCGRGRLNFFEVSETFNILQTLSYHACKARLNFFEVFAGKTKLSSCTLTHHYMKTPIVPTRVWVSPKNQLAIGY